MNNIELEQKRQRIEKWAKIIGLATAGFLFAPFAVATISGLASLITVGIIGLLTVNVGVPWFAMKLANWRLKVLKAEAAENPIETLENQYKERETALFEIRNNLQEFHGVVQSLYDEIKEHNSKYPNRPSQFQEKYEKMKQLLAIRGQKYKQAQANLKAFAEIIEEKRSDWKVALAAAKANKLANVGEDFMSKLMSDTAVDSVQNSLNTAFAELEVSLLDEQVTATPIIDITPLPTKMAKSIPEKCGPPTLDLNFDSDNISSYREKVTVI